jgi:hypothetical protein
MFKGATAKRRWLIGCLTAAGVLALLTGVLLIAFFRFIGALTKVPPESTQIVLYNDTEERLRIDAILFGNDEIKSSGESFLDVRNPDKFTWYRFSIFRDQPEMEREIFVLYTGMTSGQTWQARGIARRVLDRPCKFVVFMRPGGGEVSSCRYNELQDFEGD